jgi:hypothetical protein
MEVSFACKLLVVRLPAIVRLQRDLSIAGEQRCLVAIDQSVPAVEQGEQLISEQYVSEQWR